MTYTKFLNLPSYVTQCKFCYKIMNIRDRNNHVCKEMNAVCVVRFISNDVPQSIYFDHHLEYDEVVSYIKEIYGVKVYIYSYEVLK